MFNLLISDQVVKALERIADALERAYPPFTERELTKESNKRGPEAIIKYGDNNRLWAKGQFQELIHEKGLSPKAEAEALEEVMVRWNKEPQED